MEGRSDTLKGFARLTRAEHRVQRGSLGLG